MEENKETKVDVKLNIKSGLESYPLNTILSKHVMIVNSIYQNAQSGYSIYLVKDENGKMFKVNGTFPAPLILYGEYDISGYVNIYKGEKQLSCKSYKLKPPVKMESVKQYLSTFDNMYIFADAIYEVFKEKTIQVLKNSPEKVVQAIPSIDYQFALNWQKKIKRDEEIESSILVLTSLGLNMRDANFILQVFGLGVIYKLREDPYFLVGNVPAMTFKKVDNIAIKNGYKLDSLGRGQQALVYLLENAANEGDCFVKKDKLFSECKKLLSYHLSYSECKKILRAPNNVALYNKNLNLDRQDIEKSVKNYEKEYKKTGKKDFKYLAFEPSDELIESSFEILVRSNKSFEKDGKCFLTSIYAAEEFIAKKVSKIAKNTIDFPVVNLDIISKYLKENKIVLEKEQLKAVEDITEKMGGFYILNGGPGSGKTFVTKVIIDILNLKYKENGLKFSVRLLAPTGKASKVLREYTGIDAYTIHRGLECRGDGTFNKNKDNPFKEDLIVVDESSMLEVIITRSLMEAIKIKTKVVFVGDVDQLPPIGPGCILKDLIKSGCVNINTLTIPKRQLEKSTIISNAKNIISKEMIKSDDKRNDFFVLNKKDEDECRDAVIKGIRQLMEKRNYTLNNIQILTPLKNGTLGSTALNYYIQQAFNPRKEGDEEIFKQKIVVRDEKSFKNVERNVFFRVGDKIIHNQNNYQKDWYVEDPMLGYRKEFGLKGITNGECGVIVKIEKISEFGIKRERITVKYDNGYVFYDDDFFEIDHAFALTIHKSQGSQWPAVIVPVIIPKNMNKNFFTNNLIYTACTRCEKIAIVAGNPDDMLYAIRNKTENDRDTSLSELLVTAFNEEF